MAVWRKIQRPWFMFGVGILQISVKCIHRMDLEARFAGSK